MIFFVIPKSLDRNNTEQLMEYIGASKLRPDVTNAFQVLAWNEVFESLDEFFEAVMTTGAWDALCQCMAKSAKTEYGIDPLADDELEYAHSQFLIWCHPMIGNLVNSPNLRPTDNVTQLKNWSQLPGVNCTTINAIDVLMKSMPTLKRAPRDQTRMVHNTTELARAFIGELSANGSKHVEKLLALKLLRSDMLLESQIGLIKRMMAVRGEVLRKTILKFGFTRFEYGRYYLPHLTEVTGENRVLLFNALVNSIWDPVIPLLQNRAANDCLGRWIVLPPTIQCAILINDLRKCDNLKSPIFHRSRPVCRKLEFQYLTFPEISARKAVKRVQPQSECSALLRAPCSVIWESGNKRHVPRGLGLAWSWNRDEYHPAVATYRVHLCPQWGGSSGHTTGGISHWLTALQEDLRPEDACTVGTSLFMLWRLYYDKRISAMHCMVETLEATLCEAVMPKPIELDAPLSHEFERVEDAWQIIVACAVTGKPIGDTGKHLFGVNPISILKSTKESFLDGVKGKRAIARLQQLINRERHAISASYFLPQWSHETDPVIGTEVLAFGHGKISTLAKLV